MPEQPSNPAHKRFWLSCQQLQTSGIFTLRCEVAALRSEIGLLRAEIRAWHKQFAEWAIRETALRKRKAAAPKTPAR